MSNENTANENGNVPNQPKFAIERIYVKDISLETPKNFDASNRQSKPRVDLDINTSQKAQNNDRYEVTLRLTVTVKNQETEELFYLIEINQSGLFFAAGFSDQERQRVLATVAPNTLFPYARETIDSLVTKAGFPPLRLAPINFDALFQAAAAKQQAAAVAAKNETVQ